MTKTISVIHVTESRKCDFETFVRRFEGLLGVHDASAYRSELANKGLSGAAAAILKGQEGSSGLMLFSTYDHGKLLNIQGAKKTARQYVVGNPLHAARMTAHDIRAGLYAPLRVLVYVDRQDHVAVEYDLPSSLFGQFENEKINEVARELDRKLSDLIFNSYEGAAADARSA
jgi:uncharacterized protein (DUF302 family)